MLINLKKISGEQGKTLQNVVNLLTYDSYEVLEHLMYVILPSLVGDIEKDIAWIVQLKTFDQVVSVLKDPKKSWYFTLNKNMVLRIGMLERVLNLPLFKVMYSYMQPYENSLFKNFSFLTSEDEPFWVEYTIFQGRTQNSFILKHSGLYRKKDVSIVAIPNSIIPPEFNLEEYLLTKELKKIAYHVNKKEHQQS